jgi:hypothetical protein
VLAEVVGDFLDGEQAWQQRDPLTERGRAETPGGRRC